MRVMVVTRIVRERAEVIAMMTMENCVGIKINKIKRRKNYRIKKMAVKRVKKNHRMPI